MPLIGRWRSVVRGAGPILVASGVAGVAGYLATAVIGATRPPAEYAAFGVLWATTYLIVAALSGVQQEITRATHPVEEGEAVRTPGVAFRFGAVAVLIVAGTLALTGPVWGPAVFGDDAWPLVPPVVVAAASYVVVAVLAGTLYGLRIWWGIAAMIVADGLLRMALLLVCVALSADIGALAWAIATPFAVVPIVLWWFVRGRVRGRSRLDVRPRRLVANVMHTIVAAVAAGVLVSGFPLIMQLAVPAADPGAMGSAIFAITIVRAPLVVIVISLQSFLVTQFRGAGTSGWRTLARLGGLMTACALVVAVLVAVVGPSVFAWLWPAYDAPGWYLGGLVAASGALALLYLTGTFTLARGYHRAYTLGWAVAVVVGAGVLLVPADLFAVVVAALIVGPLLGVVVHASAVAMAARRQVSRVSA